MNRAFIVTASLFFAAFLPRVQAQEASTNEFGGEARYVHNSPGGNTQGFVRMYDVDPYDIGEFDVFGHTGWNNSLFDFKVDDIRSRQESGNLAFSWGSAVNLKGSLDIIGMRSPWERSGNVVNGHFYPIDSGANITDKTNGISPANDFFRRYFQDEELTVSLPGHPEYRLFVGNWLVQDRGDRALVGNSNKLYNLSIDRFTRENTFGLDLNIGQNGQAYYEYAYRKFVDYAQTPTSIAIDVPHTLNVPDQDVNTNKIAFRYNPSAKLFLAGSALTRVRDNYFNNYTQHNYFGNLSALYRLSKDLSLSARLYGNAYQVTTNNGWNFAGNSRGALGQAPNDIDFLFLKGDFTARYGMDNMVLTAAYKPEMTRRSGAEFWTEVFTATAPATGITYQNQVLPLLNPQSQGPALQDTKHSFVGTLAIQLPKNAELDLHERFMVADAAGYENQATLENEHGIGLTAQLPQNIAWMGDFTDMRSQNQRSHLTNFRSSKDTVMTGLNWSEGKGRGSLGVFYTYEEGTDEIDAWFGISNIAFGGAVVSPLINEVGAPYHYRNNVLSVNATVKPVEKLTLTGDASYTTSVGQFSTNGVFNPTFTTGAGLDFEAMNPTDLRVARFGLNARYDLCKAIALRVGYQHETWVDLANSINDGRDDIFNVGVNAKF